MRQEGWKDILYFFYIITVLIFAFIYFAVPERAAFLTNQKKWWEEFMRLYAS